MKKWESETNILDGAISEPGGGGRISGLGPGKSRKLGMVDGEIFDGKKDVILPKGIDNITIIR